MGSKSIQQQRVHDLSIGERQRIEILRALMSAPRVLILDEPTSVLTPQATERLFETLRELSADGVSIIFISHKLHEVRSLATRCVVMRAGKVVGEVDPRSESDASLARLMLGAEPPPIAAHESAAGDVALAVRRLEFRGIRSMRYLDRCVVRSAKRRDRRHRRDIGQRAAGSDGRARGRAAGRGRMRCDCSVRQ